jgi:hypothetical protein
LAHLNDITIEDQLKLEIGNLIDPDNVRKRFRKLRGDELH